MKTQWKTVSKTLDYLFFLPLAKNESLELRASSIDAYLEAHSYTWDDVIQCILSEEIQSFKMEQN